MWGGLIFARAHNFVRTLPFYGVNNWKISLSIEYYNHSYTTND